MPKVKSQSQAELDAANNGNMELDPLIDALLGHLPPPGDVFSPEDRKLWMQILELSLQLIYLDKEPDETGDTQSQQLRQQ